MAGKRKIEVIASSGNIFADMGMPEPEEALARAQLGSRIRHLIAERRLTQVNAARLMEISQPKVSAIINGRLANFSSERLMRLLTMLGQDVEITVRATTHERGHVRVRSFEGVHAGAAD